MNQIRFKDDGDNSITKTIVNYNQLKNILSKEAKGKEVLVMMSNTFPITWDNLIIKHNSKVTKS